MTATLQAILPGAVGARGPGNACTKPRGPGTLRRGEDIAADLTIAASRAAA